MRKSLSSLAAAPRSSTLREAKGALAAGFASLMVGLAVIATRDIATRIDPLQLAFLRYFPAGLCFLPALWLRRERIASRDALALGLLGAVFYCLYPWLFSASLKYTTALHGALILPLIPMATLLAAAALRLERITWQKLSGIAVATAGVAVTLAGSFITDAAVKLPAEAWKGDLLMLACVGLCAAFNTLSRPFVLRYSTLTVTSVTMAAGCVSLIAVVPLGAVAEAAADFSGRDWAIVGFLSLGAAAAGNYLWILALGLTTASRVALFTTIPPVVVVILGTVLLGEQPTLASLLGLMLVLSGIVLAYGGKA
ncbi:DMT family transporter [Ramlibacter tataouinensis]|uniref:Candidate transporter n=1 Tax=Ramlibacter tataouinensis (strain ATCC BAA-407 / DSM 14655 / LMG 21543 / TTB310) TaxID=365046 RepID=F5XY20_RAMTT|nr:DMT family transporter [Ramlibacter tataouinensis]AEG94345.1 Candidate transporter [Ramlibacter tataouinensis TTB310]